MKFLRRTSAVPARIVFAFLACSIAIAESTEETAGLSDVLSADQWKELDERVDRALGWIARQQEADGSFRGPVVGQPAITGFCVLAFLSRGHSPGQGPYGEQIQRAVEYILSCQRRNGVFSGDEQYERAEDGMGPAFTAMYNHGVAGVTLSELHGMTRSDMDNEIISAIRRALELTKGLQDRRKSLKIDEGGWRYLPVKEDFCADLSVTSWQLMFYRSARNSGFNIESDRIDRAMKFVLACYDKNSGGFLYHPNRSEAGASSRAMTCAGILALAHSGKLDSPMAKEAGNWMHAHPFTKYGDGRWFHYSLCYAFPAMYMLGEEYWGRFFPLTARLLLDNQDTQGNWRADPGLDVRFGNVYTTALVVIGLCVPNQLLPIFQR